MALRFSLRQFPVCLDDKLDRLLQAFPCPLKSALLDVAANSSTYPVHQSPTCSKTPVYRFVMTSILPRFVEARSLVWAEHPVKRAGTDAPGCGSVSSMSESGGVILGDLSGVVSATPPSPRPVQVRPETRDEARVVPRPLCGPATPLSLIMHCTQVCRDAGHRTERPAKPNELGMLRVSRRPPSQHRLREKPLAPHRDQPACVKVLPVKRPQAHCRYLREVTAR